MKRILLATLAVCFAGSARADIFYSLRDYSGFAAGWSYDGGFITTDGTIGAITADEIVDWQVAFTSPIDSYIMTPSNSTVSIGGVGGFTGQTLTADLTDITQSKTTSLLGQLMNFNLIGASKSVQIRGGGSSSNPRILLFDVQASPGDTSVTMPLVAGNVASVPEPSMSVVVSAGLLAAAYQRRRKGRGPGPV